MIQGIHMEINEKAFEALGIAGIGQKEIEEKLAGYLAPYAQLLPRRETIYHFACMVKGHLGDVEKKSMWKICGSMEGIDEYRNMANFMTRSQWDDDGMLGMHQREPAKALSDPMGMITGDGDDFPKSGNSSVGVSRQYCGRLGKNENYQAGVFVGYAGPRGFGLVDSELFIPFKWFGDDFKEKWEKCRVPKDWSS